MANLSPYMAMALAGGSLTPTTDDPRHEPGAGKTATHTVQDKPLIIAERPDVLDFAPDEPAPPPDPNGMYAGRFVMDPNPGPGDRYIHHPEMEYSPANAPGKPAFSSYAAEDPNRNPNLMLAPMPKIEVPAPLPDATGEYGGAFLANPHVSVRHALRGPHTDSSS